MTGRHSLRPIHPFAARMAPDIAVGVARGMPEGSVLLDPMCGSGTVLRAGAEAGLRSVGFDIDPLSVLMAQLWVAPPNLGELFNYAHESVRLARSLDDMDVCSWFDPDTTAFATFWFGSRQRGDLARLATAIELAPLMVRSALKVALSRIIVTKDRGASLARDVSHSRPHRVMMTNDYDVFEGFLQAIRQIAERLGTVRLRHVGIVRSGDARRLSDVADCSVDVLISSPPYLNAIDYIRGHRLALIWLGHSVSSLRMIRSESIGAERILADGSIDPLQFMDGGSAATDRRLVGWVTRYMDDAKRVTGEMGRILRSNGALVLVVGNSTIRGTFVDSAQIYRYYLEAGGLTIKSVRERIIPQNSRYLPLPSGASTLAQRMRTESVIEAVL